MGEIEVVGHCVCFVKNRKLSSNRPSNDWIFLFER